jgi:WD40 repeat protein
MKKPTRVFLVLSLFALSFLLPASLGACDVSGVKSPPPLTVEMLKNAEYPSEWTEQDFVTLKDGEYREEYVAGGMHFTNRVWLKLHALGDLNGDGAADAAVVLVSNSGGSGSLVTLVAVLNDDGAPRSVDTASLGINTSVKSMTIESGEITLNVLTFGTNDPNCCPTVEDTLEYELQGDTLVATHLPPSLGMETESPSFIPPIPLLGSGIEGLQPEPPWLIIATADGLWAANMDGSNPVLLISQASGFRWIQSLNYIISSPAHQIAVVTSEGKESLENLFLQTISLPEGKLHKLTNLTSHGIQLRPNGYLPGDMEFIGQLDWSPDGRKLAFIGALDESEADVEVYVYEMDTGRIQRISHDDGQNMYPSWSPDGKFLLYYGWNGLYAAVANGSSWKVENINTVFPNDEVIGLSGWRDHETMVITASQASSATGRLHLYNIRTDKQNVLNQGSLVDAVVVADRPETDAGAILYNDMDEGMYLLPPGSAEPLKVEGAHTQFIHWDEEGRSFIILWDYPKRNLCTLMADSSHKQCAPFGSGFKSWCSVDTYGLIWGWACGPGETAGVWISGPGLETLHILDQPAHFPMWNTDNDLLFFVGSTLYRTTFDSYYTDVAPIASFGEDVINSVAWMGWEEALAKKYGP